MFALALTLALALAFEPIMSQAFDSSSHPLTSECAARLRSCDPAWYEAVRKLVTQTSRGVLEPKVAELVQLATHASVTGMNTQEIRRHVRGALQNDASLEEILAVFKLCSVIGIHAMAVASPILAKSLEQSGKTMDPAAADETPMINALRARERFNPAWTTIEKWDPAWLDCFLAVGLDPDVERVLGERTLELLYIAIDATVTHLYCPGTQRHIDVALSIGIHAHEILEVLKLVSIQGLRSIEAGIRILDEEFEAGNADLRT
jgi:alkylhydroperoxidase/carboxymuconolactone decarboxylase family protein YurZ